MTGVPVNTGICDLDMLLNAGDVTVTLIAPACTILNVKTDGSMSTSSDVVMVVINAWTASATLFWILVALLASAVGIQYETFTLNATCCGAATVTYAHRSRTVAGLMTAKTLLSRAEFGKVPP